MRLQSQPDNVEMAPWGSGAPPADDSDIPDVVRVELMRCATSNGRISYYYLCDVFRRGRSGPLLAALHALLANPHGCPMCDSGTLRNPAKSHWDNCPYLAAHQALGVDGGAQGDTHV